MKLIRFVLSHPIGRRNRLASIFRLIRWQIGSRALRQPVVMPFVEDTTLIVEKAMTGATGNVYCGLHEFCEMAFLLHFLRPDDEFIDIGANIGSYSVLASGVVGASTIAIEPVAKTYSKLCRNLRVNDICQKVKVLKSIIGQTGGSLWFSTDQDTMNKVVSDSYPGTKELIEVNRLDDVLKDCSPIFWKVDVEGFELEVLSGAQRSILSPQLRAVLLESDNSEIRDKMLGYGFTDYKYEPFSRKIERVNGQATNMSNTLWIRDLDYVQSRCTSARAFNVCGVDF